MAGSNGPVETKVTAATAAAVITAFVIWLLDTYVFVGDDGIPSEVGGLVSLVVIGLVTFAAGWLAKHTPRPADYS